MKTQDQAVSNVKAERFMRRRRRARVHKVPHPQDKRASDILTNMLGTPYYVVRVQKQWYGTENPYDVEGRQGFDSPYQILWAMLKAMGMLTYVNPQGVECVIYMR